MSTFVLPLGYIHWTLTLRHVLISRPMLISGAAGILTPPFTQSNNNTLLSDLAAALAPVYDSEMTFPELDTLVGGDPPGRFVSTGSAAGSRTTVNEPSAQVCYLLSKQSGFSGRRYRGRIYLPASNEAAFAADGRLSAGEITILTTAAAAILTAQGNVSTHNNMNGAVILHSGAPTTPTPITALTVGQTVATQRRRLVRTA